jgi:ABC-type multidrug transport system ATPase subunit
VLKVEKLRIGNLPSLSFEVARGECLAVEGPSGTGKTRLLRAIADLDDAAGYVSLDGAERHEMAGPAWRKQVRYFSAEPGWWASTPREHFERPGPDAEARLQRLVRAVGLDAGVLDQPLAQLSTGQRVRLALVRGLLDQPPVLLFDEPTGALDAESAALVVELIRFQLLASRVVVLVSHNPDEVARLAHQRLLLGAPSASGMPASPRASGGQLQAQSPP